MRLLVRRKIWRAFPELDRFSDEQCARFVKAARKAKLVRARSGLLIGAASGLAIGGAITAFKLLELWLSGFLPRGLGEAGHLAVMAALAVPVFGPFALCVLILSDRQLRKRIQHVLTARGTCPSCSYSLVGLPVPESLKVVCPECAMEMTVDPSLGELAPDAEGKKVFAPREQSLPAARWLTKRRIRRLGMGALVVIVLLTFSAGAWWLLWNNHLRREAQLAAAEMPTVDDAVKSLRQASAGETDPGKAWVHLVKARSALDAAIANATGTTATGPLNVDFASVYTTRDDQVFGDAEAWATYRKSALDSLAAFERGTGLAEIESMVRCVAVARPTSQGGLPATTAAATFRALYFDIVSIAGLLTARMHVAQEAGRWDDFVWSLKGVLHLAGMMESEPGWTPRESAGWIRANAYRVVRRALLRNPDSGILAQIVMEIDADRWMAFEAAAESARQVALSHVCEAYSDPVVVRVQRLNQFFGIPRDWRFYSGDVGSYSRCRDEVNGLFVAVVDAVKRAPFERSEAWLPKVACTMSVSTAMSVGTKLSGNDIITFDRRTTRVMIAIEEFKRRHGRLPVGLNELVPGWFDAIPLDPWSGKPLCYRATDGSSVDGPGYVMYSVGFDGEDNGGVETTVMFDLVSPQFARRRDFVITSPERR